MDKLRFIEVKSSQLPLQEAVATLSRNQIKTAKEVIEQLIMKHIEEKVSEVKHASKCWTEWYLLVSNITPLKNE